MKKMFNVRSIVAMIIMATLATTAFAGCNQSADGNQEESSLSAPSSTVSEVTSQEESSVAEPSKVESSIEEKSKEESKAESSVVEKSEIESSVESSVDEKSKEESKVESSIVESSVEQSQVESSVQESSKESSKVESSVSEPSKVESSASESSNSVSIKDAIGYGRVKTYCPAYDLDDLSSIYKEIILKPDSLVPILSINDVTAYNGFFMFETYEILYSGKRYVVCRDDIDLLAEDYVPDFSDENWVGLD